MSWYKSLPVKAKLLTAFILIILLTCVISGVSVYGSLEQQKIAKEVDHELNKEYGIIQRTMADISRFRSKVFEFNTSLLNFTPENADSAQAIIDRINEDLTLLHSSTNPANVEVIKVGAATFISAYKDRMYPFLDKGYSVDSRKVFNEEVYPGIDSTEAMLTQMSASELSNLNSQVSTLNSNKAIYFTLTVTVIAVVIAIVLAVLLSDAFVKTLKYAAKNANLLAKGDLSVKIQTDRTDEFGILIQSLENMRVNLNDSIKTVHNVSNDVIDSISAIKEDTNVIGQSSSTAKDRTMTVAAASDEMVSTTGDIAKNCETAASKANGTNEITQNGTKTVDEVRALASRTTKSTQEITKMVNQIQTDAKVANDAMGTSVTNMDSLASDTSNIKVLLHDISSKVGDVTGQISQIATAAEEQTTATSEISQNMQEITKSSEGLANQVSQIIDQLNGSIDKLGQLQELVTRFKYE